MANHNQSVLDAVDRYVEDHGGSSLLQNLPDAKDMHWEYHPGEIAALFGRDSNALPQALRLARNDDEELFACLIQHGDKPREVRFYAQPAEGAPYSTTSDAVGTYELARPFQYLNGGSKSEKRRLSIMIKYYYLLAGHINEGVGGDLADFHKRFYRALQIIKSGEIERLNSGVHNGNVEQDEEHERSPEAQGLDDDSGSDYATLKQYLAEKDAAHLLANIPSASSMTFMDQKVFPDGQPKKLYVGRGKNDGEMIWAYMRFTRKFHEIRFHCETESGLMEPKHMVPESAARLKLIHPFKNTYHGSGAGGIDQGEKARLSLMVKFYFLAAGIAKNIVLTETKDYPRRLLDALHYITAKTGGASYQHGDQQYEGPEIDEGPLDETHIQSTLGENVSISDVNEEGTPRARRQQITPRPSTSEGPRGTKRTAEDAQFDEVRKLYEKDTELTEQLNDLDNQIQELEMRRQALNIKRSRNRDQIRRKSLQL
ncbi:hypothetical protein K469DRAFT_712013 [Zopfia rhizophila CBS 207.26]|uniref:Uncharacterized protein n=1 Tax=Zopfia rhizophila CBS 207.26 TaxID=1314779 RepID=A0A6A6DW17_9PEZI|nr:hypothetical protein K469DRAFT_712013 [Zopfia rhizophila CBS 207.26]